MELHKDLADAVEELSMKHGATQAIRFLQQALNDVLSPRSRWIREDGIVGAGTIHFAKTLPTAEVIQALDKYLRLSPLFAHAA